MFCPLTANRWARPERWNSATVPGSMRSSWPSTKPRRRAACASGVPWPSAASARSRTRSVIPATPPRRAPVRESDLARTTVAMPRRRRYERSHSAGARAMPRAATSAPTGRSATGSGASTRSLPSAATTRTRTSPCERRGTASTNPRTSTSAFGRTCAARASIASTRAAPTQRPTRTIVRARAVAVTAPKPRRHMSAVAAAAQARSAIGGRIAAAGEPTRPATSPPSPHVRVPPGTLRAGARRAAPPSSPGRSR